MISRASTWTAENIWAVRNKHVRLGDGRRALVRWCPTGWVITTRTDGRYPLIVGGGIDEALAVLRRLGAETEGAQ